MILCVISIYKANECWLNQASQYFCLHIVIKHLVLKYLPLTLVILRYMSKSLPQNSFRAAKVLSKLGFPKFVYMSIKATHTQHSQCTHTSWHKYVCHLDWCPVRNRSHLCIYADFLEFITFSRPWKNHCEVYFP